MYEFSKQEKEFLKRFGQTGNGKELLVLLRNVSLKIDRASGIPKGSDYGAQVEGRALMVETLGKLIQGMTEKRVIPTGEEPGVDEYD